MKDDDTPPHGLRWGDAGPADKRKPTAAATKTEDVKGLFAATMVGAAAAPRVPPPAGAGAAGDDPIAALFGDQRVAAPSILDQTLSEAELSRLEASKKRDLLNDRLAEESASEPARAKVIPIGVVANDTPKPRPASSHKMTLVGAGVMAPPREWSDAPTPPTDDSGPESATQLTTPRIVSQANHEGRRSSALDSTIPSLNVEPISEAGLVPPPTPVVVNTRAAEPAARTPPATRRKADSSTSAKTRSSGAGRPGAAPPPPPAAAKTSIGRVLLVTFASIVLVIAAGIGGALAGFYPLPSDAAALLGLRSARDKPAVATTTRAAPPRKPPIAQPAPVPPSAAKVAEIAKPAEATKPAETIVPVTAAQEPPQAVAPAAKPVAVAVRETSTAPAGSRDAQGLVESAHRKLASHDAAGAEALARQVLAADPNEHHAMEVLAQALIDEGRPRDAVTYAEQIVKKRPKRASYRVIEGDAKRLSGDHDGAQAAYRAALELDPHNAEIVRRLGL